MPPKLYYSMLMERSISFQVVNAWGRISYVAGANRYRAIEVPYQRTEAARNYIVGVMLSAGQDPDDTVVMLDCDELHPEMILSVFASHMKRHELGVVGGLTFLRGEPPDPMFFYADEGGHLRSVVEWKRGALYSCDAVASGAIAIKRWVFEELDKHGFAWPYFRYEYPQGQLIFPSEDIFFCKNCRAAEIQIFCDTSIVSPHADEKWNDERTWDEWRASHPDVFIPPSEIENLRALEPATVGG